MGEERQEALPFRHPGRHLPLHPSPDVLREQHLAAGLFGPLPFPLEDRARPARGDGESEAAAPPAIEGVAI